MDGKSARQLHIAQILPYSPHKGDLELQRLLRGLEELQSCPDISIVEMLFPSDPRASSQECCDAISKEVIGLLKRGVFKEVNRKEVPPDANVFSSRMALAIKDIGTEAEKYKARLVIHGHKH